VALYLADHLRALRRAPPAAERPRGELHDALRAHLQSAGASFFQELHRAAGGGLIKPVVDALWDLVWAGELTNDSPEALRSFLRTAAARNARRDSRPASFRSRRQAPAAAVGRWTLLPDPEPANAARRGLALAEQLLARHGVLTREALRAEELEGGFAAVYPALKAMEEVGRVRRGYFVAGLGGLQFADPGALERLRMLRDSAAADDGEPPAVVLAATDPGSPWGAALAWPPAPGPGPRPMRAAGSHVLLVDGRLAGFLTRDARDLRVFLPEEQPARSAVARGVARALRSWAESSGRGVIVSAPAGDPPSRGPLAPFMAEAGFEAFGPGFRLARTGARSG
jgi:ATP-dependent Lhr-like helicase